MTTKLHGAEAQDFARENLRKLVVNSETWEVFWWRPKPFQFWLETFPHSEAHGGGPQDLALVPSSELDQKLSASSGSDAPDMNSVVRFVFDRWRERRALSPLRFILNGWYQFVGLANLTSTEAELVRLLVNRADLALSER